MQAVGNALLKGPPSVRAKSKKERKERKEARAAIEEQATLLSDQGAL